MLNGIAIAIVDFLYLNITDYFVARENHKYEDEYERSFVFKLFLFKFLNTNMPLFYLGFILKDFQALYKHLIGMTI